MIEACAFALDHNLGLRPGESVVVVTDAGGREVARAFHDAARRISSRVDTVEIPVAARNGQEPPGVAARRMAEADVALLVTTSSLSWTGARAAACAAGTRIASMATITPEIVERTLGIDYGPVRERANRLCDRLDAGATVRICSLAGTDLSMSIAGRTAHGRKGGIYRSPGHWGNLPCGEAFIAPVEGSTEGVYVVDGSHGGVGRVSSPVRVVVENGSAVRIEGGSEARLLREMLDRIGDLRAFNVAEFGIGCNHAARVTGVTLEDEKALGTCHVALGSNSLFGGTVEVGIHVDGVMLDPQVRIDGRPARA